MPAAVGAGAELEPKQARFVREYLVDLNAKQAAIRAGYSEKTAESQGSRLLSHAKVKAAVEAGQAKVHSKLELSAGRVLQELARLAFADIRKLYDDAGSLKSIHELDDDTAATISAIEVDEVVQGDKVRTVTRKIRRHDKNQALVSLAKHFKLLTDKIEHTGKDGAPLDALSTLEIGRRALFILAKFSGGTETKPTPHARGKA